MNAVAGVRGAAWLWWVALFIVTIGGVIVYLLSQQPMTSPEITQQVNFTLAITFGLAGTCIILATADWWLR